MTWGWESMDGDFLIGFVVGGGPIIGWDVSGLWGRRGGEKGTAGLWLGVLVDVRVMACREEEVG